MNGPKLGGSLGNYVVEALFKTEKTQKQDTRKTPGLVDKYPQILHCKNKN